MSFIKGISSSSRLGPRVIAVAALLLGSTREGSGQQPVPATSPPANAYRPPTIALVEPVADASVPQDHPIVMFRFSASDSSDPVEAHSLVVAVDGKDRTTLFQVAGEVAFGPLAPPPNDHQLPIAVGPHAIAARVCSLRSLCGEVAATVTIAASPALTPEDTHVSAIQTLLDLLLTLIKRLLTP